MPDMPRKQSTTPAIQIDTTNLSPSTQFSSDNEMGPNQQGGALSSSPQSIFLNVPDSSGGQHHNGDQNSQNNISRVPSDDCNSSSYTGTTLTESNRGGVKMKPSVSFDLNAAELNGDDAEQEKKLRQSSPFAFTPRQLGTLTDPKSLDALRAMGGAEGLCRGLHVDMQSGLSIDEGAISKKVTLNDAVRGHGVDSPTQSVATSDNDDTSTPADLANRRIPTGRFSLLNNRQKSDDHQQFTDRKRVFSRNVLPEKPTKNIFQLMWIALHDKILILLSIAAVVSLALGLYTTFRPIPGTENQPRVDWVEGVAILVAVLVVCVVGAANDYQKERQFAKLNRKKEDREVKVIRSGKTCLISVHDVLVGDIMLLEPGDMVPVDGVLLSGSNCICDESSATGESDALKKLPAEDCLAAMEPGAPFSNKHDCIILSGSRVIEGVGRFIVTAVGINSFFGKTMMSLRVDAEDTPLQQKLNKVATLIAYFGSASALLLFLVLLIEFLANLSNNDASSQIKGQEFVQILIVAVTIVVVAVPEGLPLAVTLALAFAMTRMLKDNNLVRVLRACETMGNASTICSDKTGTLTQNQMTVVAGILGPDGYFSEQDDSYLENEENVEESVSNDSRKVSRMKDYLSSLSSAQKDLIVQSVVQNSTAFENKDNKGDQSFIGSKTETALLQMTRNYMGMGDVATERSNAKVVQVIPFGSERKCMGTVVQLTDKQREYSKDSYRLYVKGASEILLEACCSIISRNENDALETNELSSEIRNKLEKTIYSYATHSLRTISLVYRDFESWPPKDAKTLDDDPKQADFTSVFEQMTLASIVGIMDPLRPGVKQAVTDCVKAGIIVRMVTGDNVVTARAIASECGIFKAGGLIIEGPKFRKLTTQQMDSILPRLQVLARSSPEDKQILVRRLKALGEVVAVTGDGTNDGPALKLADVGFSMGITGTEVAKEASAIILMDDNFSSIVKACSWGRCVNDAVKKFLQFQLTVNVTAVSLAFISAVASSEQQSVLTAVQLLWVNLIMDTMAALALATDPPSPELLLRKPERKNASIISLTMWKMIIGQSIYQLTVTLVLNFAGAQIFNISPEENATMVFNTFVFMQIFNLISNRRIDNKLNVFSNIYKNAWFMSILLIIIGVQILIAFVGGAAFSITRLNGPEWAVTIIAGAITLLVGVLIRLVPDAWLLALIPEPVRSYFARRAERKLEARRQKQALEEGDQDAWNVSAVDYVRDQLLFIKTLRSQGRFGSIGVVAPRQKKTLRDYIPNSMGGTSPARHDSVLSRPGTASPNPSTSESTDRQRGRTKSGSALAVASMVPGMVATGMTGMWSPSSPSGSRPPPTKRAGQPLTRDDLENRMGVQIHPDTPSNDPIVTSQSPPSRSRSPQPDTHRAYESSGASTQPPTSERDRRGSHSALLPQ